MDTTNRITPQLPAGAFKTYAVSAPISTHRRSATCAEYGCRAYQNGWQTALDSSIPGQAGAANWIRLHSSLKYTVEENATAVTFTFPPGQTCFDGRMGKHTVPLDREPLYLVKGGDWRGNPRGIQTVTRNAEDWVDDFANHQIELKTRLEQG